MSLGLKLATERLGLQVRHRWAVEIDKDAVATYKRNFPETAIEPKDIREVKLADLVKVNGMAFGFPCNDFSVVGEQRGVDGTYGPLYSYCVRAVNLKRPDWFVAENVGGIRSANAGLAFEQILTEFVNAGYVLTPHLFRFEDYGVPQRRHRVLIVGIKKELGLKFRVPKPLEMRRTARQAIEEPPIPEDANNHERTKQAPQVVARLDSLRPGENAFSANVPEDLRLNVKGARISQIYRRLDPDKPAYTVTGSGGGGTHVYHWSEPRALTNRERARLQTFPDDYVFEGKKEAVRRQIGMAVPPRGAQVVFEALLKTLQGIEYEFVNSNLGARYARLSEAHSQVEMPLRNVTRIAAAT
jgi:DNA (cytosine-5)-methyltransferase 1